MILTNAAVDNCQFAKMAEGIARLKKVLYLYCPPRSKFCAVKPATSASWSDVVRHAAKIAHKVCENRKIYLKFLNKPNFNVPKNWGKIFGKTA